MKDDSPLALLLAHGSPSDPAPQEQAIAALAARVAALASGWRLRGATLAAPGSLEAAVAPGAVVYPLFMSDGWFVSRETPRRLALAGAGDARILPPLGLDARLPALCARRAVAAARAAGYDVAQTALILAAHGSPKDPRPARAARDAAQAIALLAPFRSVTACFVEEPPLLAEGLAAPGPAICLPFFAIRAGHVTGDLPEAVAETRFSGPVLDPIGCDAEIAALIAATLADAAFPVA